ncbi:Ankyrin repeats (3 copies) family protein [Cryptosporidium meleagridis]|uniref:Ankyrin repeats (3 copies) family protein n=1 Tax=Cryptosporidium meleagridis TaxID=93969 RepID=A0A2P4Z2E3_9CRYT|nr:Ankyrin repeats (3 copies) family protein [Cryptosporidium meleagridis]
MERNKFFAAIDFEDESLSKSIFESISEAQLNIFDEDERTLLHNAVSKNKLFIVELLISKGANVNTFDDNKWSPLHSCCSSGYFEIAKLLLENGADCSAKTSSGCTPLHYAASKGHEDIVKLIIAKERSVIDIQDIYGRTAIFMSACSGKQECFDLLFQANADLNLKEYATGDTILHAAINGFHEEIAYKIASKNPEMLMIKNKDGKMPLDLSSKEFTEELFEIIKKNFDPNSIEELLSK